MTRTTGVSSLKEITWGGRVRPGFQTEVWKIAKEAAVRSTSSMRGSMVSSSQTTTHQFLDGGVSDTRGFFDSSSGMRWFGEKAVAYILYKLGADPAALLGKNNLRACPEFCV